MFEYDLPTAERTGSGWKVRKQGVGKATVFPGFCARHDSEAFAPIDTQPFLSTPGEVFLHGYRSFCREFHAKTSVHRNRRALLDIVGRGGSGEEHLASIEYAAGFFDGVDESEAAFREQKARWDQMFLSGRYDELRARIYHFERPLPIMCGGSFTFEVDFLGRTIQPNVPGTSLHAASLTIFGNSTEGGYAIISWLDGNSPAANFAHSIDQVPDSRVPAAILRLAFCMVENIAVSIPWWDSLGSLQRTIIRAWLDSGVVDLQRPATTLIDGREQLVDVALLSRAAL